MSRRTLLAAAGAVDAPVDPPVDPGPTKLPADLSMTFDGNSISAGNNTPEPLLYYVVEYLNSIGALNSANVHTVAIGGQRWVEMSAAHADVDAAWEPSRTNVLIAGEDCNSVFQGGKSTAQVLQDTRDYYAVVKAAHPGWKILMWGNLPRGGLSSDAANNDSLIALNDYWRNNWQAEGIDGWVDMRTIPQYDHDGTTTEAFTAYADAWSETAPAFVHPLEGTYADNTGARAIARKIAIAMIDLDW